MENWSVLSKVMNYAQSNRKYIDFYKLDIMALEPKTHRRIYNRLDEGNMQVTDLGFGVDLKGEYLNVHVGLGSET